MRDKGSDGQAIDHAVSEPEGTEFLLPMPEPVEQAELAIEEVMEVVVGRSTIEAVLEMSAEGAAGPKQAGRARREGKVA